MISTSTVKLSQLLNIALVALSLSLATAGAPLGDSMVPGNNATLPIPVPPAGVIPSPASMIPSLPVANPISTLPIPTPGTPSVEPPKLDPTGSVLPTEAPKILSDAAGDPGLVPVTLPSVMPPPVMPPSATPPSVPSLPTTVPTVPDAGAPDAPVAAPNAPIAAPNTPVAAPNTPTAPSTPSLPPKSPDQSDSNQTAHNPHRNVNKTPVDKSGKPVQPSHNDNTSDSEDREAERREKYKHPRYNPQPMNPSKSGQFHHGSA